MLSKDTMRLRSYLWYFSSPIHEHPFDQLHRAELSRNLIRTMQARTLNSRFRETNTTSMPEKLVASDDMFYLA